MTKKKITILSIVGALVLAVILISTYFIIEANKPRAQIDDTKAKYETTLKMAPADSAPLEHDGKDVVAYLLWKVENTNSFKVKTTGESKAFVATLSISNERIVIDNKAMVSTTSSGLVSIAQQKYYSDNKVLIRGASKIDGFNTIWKDEEPECVSYDEMIRRYGWLPFKANGYIICDETYLNKDSIKVEKADNDLYKVSFDLNPDDDYAPFWYRREIFTTSNSQILPKFKAIHIEYTFDKDYRIIYQDFKETYTVKTYGIEAETTTTVRDEFIYDNVSFNDDFLNYFNKYKDLKPKEGAIQKEDDASTILLSSFGGDKLLDLELSVNNKKLNGNASINIKDLKDIKIKLSIESLFDFAYLNNNAYINTLGLKLVGSNNDLLDIANGLGFDSEKLDLNLLLEALNNLKIEKNQNDIKLSGTIKFLNNDINITANVNKNDADYNLKSLNAKFNLLNNDIEINAKEGNTQIEDDNYEDYFALSEIKPQILDLINFFKNKQYEFNIDTSLYKIDSRYLDILGNVKLLINDNNKIDGDIHLAITKYGKPKVCHVIDLKLISSDTFKKSNITKDDMIYLSYKTYNPDKADDADALKLSMPLAKIEDMLATILKLLDLDFGLINNNSLDLNQIDINQLKNLINFDLSKLLNIKDLFKSIFYDGDKLIIGLNTASDANLYIDLNDASVNVNSSDIYIYNYSNTDNLKLKIESIDINHNSFTSAVIDETGYIDLSDVDKLFNSAIRTATLKDFDISTDIGMVFSFFGSESKGNILLNAKVKVNDNYNPTMYLGLDLTNIPALFKSFITTTQLDIYYKDNFVYISKVDNNGDTYKVKVGAKAFMDNISYYLMEFGLGTQPALLSLFGTADPEVPDVGNSLKKYEVINNRYNLSIDLKNLTGNIVLGLAELSLELSNVKINNNELLALTSIKDVKLSIMSLINLSIDNLSLNNIGEDGTIDNVDVAFVDNYAKEYKFGENMIYKNGEFYSRVKHKITYKFGLNQKDKTVYGTLDEDIIELEVEDVTYDNDTYHFVGWYLDRDLTILFEENKFRDENIILYAKWVKN